MNGFVRLFVANKKSKPKSVISAALLMLNCRGDVLSLGPVPKVIKRLVVCIAMTTAASV